MTVNVNAEYNMIWQWDKLDLCRCRSRYNKTRRYAQRAQTSADPEEPDFGL